VSATGIAPVEKPLKGGNMPDIFPIPVPPPGFLL
jgi:hypothetical protein